MSDRRTRALSHLDLSGRGLEIGGGYDPLVTRAMSPLVETLDHSTQEDLIAKYHSYGLPQDKIDQIDKVDHVWSGGSLVDAVGESGCFDYIVAAHVIEHSVDLIAFLQDCENLLRDGGRLALVVPDRRFSFDFFKPLTSVGGVVDAHLRPYAFHPPGAMLDHAAYACTLDGQIAWGAGQRGELQIQFPDFSVAKEWIDIAIAQEAYQDIHRWIFTPSSFALLMEDLAELEYHHLGEVGSAPTDGFEFYVTLEKGGNRPHRLSRIERLREISRETIRSSQDHADIAPTVSAKLDSLKARLAQESAALAAMQGSTSWRITAPLRAMSARLKRLKANRGR